MVFLILFDVFVYLFYVFVIYYYLFCLSIYSFIYGCSYFLLYFLFLIIPFFLFVFFIWGIVGSWQAGIAFLCLLSRVFPHFYRYGCLYVFYDILGNIYFVRCDFLLWLLCLLVFCKWGSVQKQVKNNTQTTTHQKAQKSEQTNKQTNKHTNKQANKRKTLIARASNQANTIICINLNI